MNKTRASAFDDADLDVSGFAPKPQPQSVVPPAEKVRAVAEAANFRSREPQQRKATPIKREPRRYRTGRNVQFNVKASQVTVDAFYEISDQQKWVLGETLERALAALQRELGEKPANGRERDSE
jgi:hypothetical protein